MNDLEVIGHGTEKGTEVTFKPDPVMFTILQFINMKSLKKDFVNKHF